MCRIAMLKFKPCNTNDIHLEQMKRVNEGFDEKGVRKHSWQAIMSLK